MMAHSILDPTSSWSRRTPRAVVFVALALAITGCQSPTIAAELAGVEALVRAYPDQLDRIDGNDLLWRDGTRMTINDGRGPKSSDAWLATPDLKDIFAHPYPVGLPATLPQPKADPGRARPAAFFNKMYGDCQKGEVLPYLVDVVWLPTKYGKTLKVTARNGVAQRLAAVSARLDALPTSFDKYLLPPSGTYNCRAIARTDRLSAHGHGIAIDLNVAHSHYWAWVKPKLDGSIAYRNSMPTEIVAAFEAEGFIWGGRWYHHDTMHFEYRPEFMPEFNKVPAPTRQP
jgi:hypothetical protein